MAGLTPALAQAFVLLSLARAAAGASTLLSRHKLQHTPVLEEGKQVCAELVNRGTYFTVDVEVGTPGQRFSVVADTGSNTLIVPSCVCQQAGYCDTRDRCFTGTNKSSSFSLIKTENDQPVGIALSFGSGVIRGVLAREQVAVGGLKASMRKGILLMTGKALNFEGPFEGILGLGIPKREREQKQHTRMPLPAAATTGSNPGVAAGDVSKIIQWLRDQFGGSIGGGPQAVAKAAEVLTTALAWEDGRQMPMPGAAGQLEEIQSPPGFLEQAGISKFGICFNEGRNGVLRFGMPADNSVPVHTSLGQEHWGLGLAGISVAGKKTVPVKVCSDKDMQPGQVSACGAIPDSGTTMITGPAEGISTLLDTVCEHWELCNQNFTAMQKAAVAAAKAAAERYGVNPFDLKPWPRIKILQLLLLDCESWIGSDAGLEQLPTLEFHITGASGTRQTLKMPGHAYIIEQNIKAGASQKPSTPTGGPMGAEESAQEDAAAELLKGRTKVCAPAFSVLDYKTPKNGDVWILGTPFFYEYNVGYDLGTKPPSISLAPTKSSPCGTCDAKVGLVAQDMEVHREALRRRPLPLTGVPRMPGFDVTRPL